MKNILKFGKPGCSPCQVVDELLKREGIKYTDINGVDNPALCLEYGVRSFPQILVLNEANEVQDRIIGVVEHAIIGLK